jgi:hypothetical protein
MNETASRTHRIGIPLVAAAAALAVILPGCGGSSGSSSPSTASSGPASTAKTAPAKGAPPTSTKAACGSSTAPSAANEAASTSAGDIPDNQQFLTFRNPAAGYSISYPEGWAQSGNGSHVVFVDKGNTITIRTSKGPQPTTGSVAVQLKQEARSDPCLAAGRPQPMTVGPNRAVKVTFSTKGSQSPVTGQRPMIVVDRYVYSKNGRVAVVDLATPVGVDNVDAYRMISQSFRWG